MNKKYLKDDIEKYYPQLLPFLGEHLDKDYFGGGSMLSEETYLQICSEFAVWFNKNKKNIIDNVYDLYILTDNESGYQALSQNWTWGRKRRAEDLAKGIKPFQAIRSKKQIEKECIDMISRSMNHLSQASNFGHKKEFTHRVGNAGLLLTTSINVDCRLSEKRNLKDLDYNFNLDVSIDSGGRDTMEIEE